MRYTDFINLKQFVSSALEFETRYWNKLWEASEAKRHHDENGGGYGTSNLKRNDKSINFQWGFAILDMVEDADTGLVKVSYLYSYSDGWEESYIYLPKYAFVEYAQDGSFTTFEKQIKRAFDKAHTSAIEYNNRIAIAQAEREKKYVQDTKKEIGDELDRAEKFLDEFNQIARAISINSGDIPTVMKLTQMLEKYK